MLTYALQVPPSRFCFFHTDANTTDLPVQATKWMYACGFILRRYNNTKITLYAFDTSEVAYNSYISSTGIWTGWTVK